MDNKKIVLIDGSSLAFRAFYSILNLDTFVNKNGLHTNALYSFHNMLTNLLDKEKPTHVLVAFDKGKTTFRNEFYTEYKGGRQSTPSEFREQMPFFSVLLDLFGIHHYRVELYEADDIIGTLAHQAELEGYEVVVVSGDKDLTQLASDKTRVEITRKGISDLKTYTPASIQEEWGITPEQIIDMKGLMGDSSDNYPGVTKVGEKTALKLLHEYGSVESLYERVDEMKKSKLKENLINDKENAFLSKKLAKILTDAPIDVTLADTVLKPLDTQGLMDFYQEMSFNTFMTNLLETEEGRALGQQAHKELEYEVVEEVSPDHFGDNVYFILEMLEDNYHAGKAIAFAWENQESLYVAKPETLYQSDVFKEWAADANKAKTVMDAKRTMSVLSQDGIELNGIVDDVQVAAYTLKTTEYGKDLAAIARDLEVGNLLFDEHVYGKGAKLAVPEDKALFDHVSRKADLLKPIMVKLKDELEQTNQWFLYTDLELPLMFTLTRIEQTGIKVNPKVLEDLKVKFAKRIDEMEAEIYELAGEKFNINSPKQLGVILFDKMGLTPIKKTKTGYSTAVDVLEKLRDDSQIIDLILEYRQLTKLQSTYVEGLLSYIKEDSKIHTRLIQTLTQTGRLSSSDPNLQNIPIRTEEGREIRKAFVPREPDWLMFASDYSQIELRVLAHISNDEHMMSAFQEGMDIHTSTAMKVYGVPKEEVTPLMRRNAKAVNFGIVYGISDYGLSQNLNITRKEAQSFIDTYLENFPGIQKYMKDIVTEGREKGYVETLMGRRRYLPDINSSNFNTRSFAERTAMNSPIQGSAADIIKIAMVNMDKALKENKLKARLLLQVHDELIFEVPEEELPTLEKLVPEIMEDALKLNVPLKVDSNYGMSWYDAK